MIKTNIKITREFKGEYLWKTDNEEGYISKVGKEWKLYTTKPYFNSDTFRTFKEAKEALN